MKCWRASQGADGTNKDSEWKSANTLMCFLWHHNTKVLKSIGSSSKTCKDVALFSSQCYWYVPAAHFLQWLLYACLNRKSAAPQWLSNRRSHSLISSDPEQKKRKKEKEYPQDGLKVSQSSLLAFNAHFKIYRGLLPAFHFYFYLH